MTDTKRDDERPSDDVAAAKEPGWSNTEAAAEPRRDERAEPKAATPPDPGWSNAPPDDGISATEPPPEPIDMHEPGWSNSAPDAGRRATVTQSPAD